MSSTHLLGYTKIKILERIAACHPEPLIEPLVATAAAVGLTSRSTIHRHMFDLEMMGLTITTNVDSGYVQHRAVRLTRQGAAEIGRVL